MIYNIGFTDISVSIIVFVLHTSELTESQ